jgi:hypothetical protein
MLMASLLDRYSEKILGVLSCFDRVVIQGTLPGLSHSEGMTAYLYSREVRIFDYPRWAEPFRNALRENAEQLARESGLQIEFIRKASFRKEERIKEILAERGDHPGLVHILSAMEACPSYQPWHDKKTGRTFLKPDSGKCLHYYFYFIDEEFGLCYLRVPTWCPFRLQFYFNGHQWLANRLRKKNIGFELLDNAFVRIDDFPAAQRLADDFPVRHLHRLLDRFARRFCPVIETLEAAYHWSLMQVEYATDIIFKSRDDLAPIYETISRTAIQAVKAENVATFLGRKLHERYEGELGTDFHTRVEGTRIRHHMGPASIKMYDKFGLVLRIETTANDVSFFKHHRTVEQRDGKKVFKLAPLKKSIYSFPDLQGLLADANRRYLEFISELEDPSAGMKTLNKVCEPRSQNGRNYKGFNFFSADDQKLFEALLRGEHNISGLRHKEIRQHFPERSSGFVSRLLKRLRSHGLLKRIGKTYKYYLTSLGRSVAVTGLALKTFFVIPRLASFRNSCQI